jgi:hypothetical protein
MGMELEQLIEAFEKGLPVILHRPNEGDLHFSKIIEIIPAFDKFGQPDYSATVIDSVGRPCHVRASKLEVFPQK